MKNQNSGVRPIETFDTKPYKIKIASTVSEMKLSPRMKRQTRPVQFLWKATEEALAQSGIRDYVEPSRLGIYAAGAACQTFEIEKFFRDWENKSYEKTNFMDLAYCNWDSSTNVIADRFELFGPRNTLLTACSSSGLAIGLAYDLIRLGEVDGMVAGGTDGFSEMTFAGFQSLQSVSENPCAPFDVNRKGITFGEGSGILVLEEYEHAKKRGADILGEIVGYHIIGEAYNMTAPRPDGLGYRETMTKAMLNAKVNPEQISYINAHGTATSVNDQVEGNAIRAVFNDRKVPVNSIKGLVGHTMSAAGAVECVNTALTIKRGFLPGTKNCQTPDSEIGINIALETEDFKIKYALCNSAGFGGNNSSLLFKEFTA